MSRGGMKRSVHHALGDSLFTFLQYVNERLPQLAQGEAILSVHAAEMELYSLYDTVL
jgi:hypothetical protein